MVDSAPPDGGGRRRQDFKELSGVGYVGLFFGLAVAVGAWLGSLVDDRFGTNPWGVSVGAILGSVSGFRELYRVAKKAMESDASDAKKGRGHRGGAGGDDVAGGPGGLGD